MTTTGTKEGKGGLSQALPYVAPLLAFMIFLSGESYFPDQHYLLYPVKTLLVVAVLAWGWKSLPSLKPSSFFLSIIVGVIGVFLWVQLDPWAHQVDYILEDTYNRAVSAIGLTSWQTELDSGIPAGRDPFLLYPQGEAWALFAFRVIGITLVVPIMEELFWRGFLMRWLIKEDFLSVPLGQFTPFSFWVTTFFFASIHGSEWLLGLVVGIFYGAWFVRTKNLGNIMVAHGVTNFLLAIYCFLVNDWHFLSAICPVPVHK